MYRFFLGYLIGAVQATAVGNGTSVEFDCMLLQMQGVFKKRPNFCYKDFILQHFKHCPLQSSPLYWRYTVPNVSSIVRMLPGTHFSDGAQFSSRIFLNLRVFKKRQNFLNSAPTSKGGALRLLSVPSGRF